MKSSARFVLLGILFLSWSCTGCTPAGTSRQAVQGIVTLDGKPVSGITLVFAPVEGMQTGAVAEVVDGRFSLTPEVGPSAGKHYVTVDTVQPELEEFERLRQAGERPFSLLKIHPRYKVFGSMEAMVSRESENTFTFELKSR